MRLRSEGRWAAHPNPCKSAPAISAYPSLTSNPADTREGRLEAMWQPGICAYPLCSFVWLSGDGSRHGVHVVCSAIRKRCGKLCAMRSALRESQVSLFIGTMGRRPKGIVARLLLASVRGHIAGRYRASICRHTATLGSGQHVVPKRSQVRIWISRSAWLSRRGAGRCSHARWRIPLEISESI